jgi:hypothetical protein
MSSPNSNTPTYRVPPTTPSRPGIKFVICVVAALVVVAIVVINN